MSDRKAELERKKLRLQQIREEKKRKEEEKKKKEANDATKAVADAAGAGDKNLERKRQDADALLQELGLPQSAGSPPSPSKSSVSDGGSQDSSTPDTTPYIASASPRHKLKLGRSKPTIMGFPPKEVVTYAKETQTPTETQDKEDRSDSEDDDEEMPLSQAPATVTPVPEAPPAEEEKEEEPKVQELTEEEIDQILASEEFLNFFSQSTKVVERALTEDKNIFIDYRGKGDEDGEGDKDAGAKLSLNYQFFDERWSRHRTVTSLDWSSQFPELVVGSYNNNEESPHEPDGVALVWNMKFKEASPEFVFHFQSAVMSAAFARFHPNLVIGGTYSGQIVLWDNRSTKRTPVQRSPLSAAAHTHPVYCVNVVGTQNAHNLISVSTDGKMCSWSLDMLSQPQDSMELHYKQSKSVAVTSMTFPSNDVNNFVVGSEDGSVYTACRHGSKAGINEAYEAHQGPVTGIDCHHVQGQLDFSHLFLSSSFDWTIKLWSLKQSKPLYSFEDNSDYVYDVQWSPVHPALFATVDGMGKLDLWNLNNETEVPTASVTLDGQPAANRVRWSHNGQQIAAGDAEGRVFVYDVGESLATPRHDEWSRFVRTLADIKAVTADAEEDDLSR
ncbi:cytoplasmic dynein 1 intermediate chain 2-like isoform X1 [Patiria miniata]|uniref:Cytoplasmic dynein 1 intermediate chain 2 n=1 Tax=Patiria miniata TaxID=46514 RepID=A0A914A3G6_PATMI|nr:cytoplasmic dynein 1 intermediate chain 2-like isoform X1 [Patiria miniata]XP_038058215.1 cytoplasmic dynein 1 intermediate chain 2-like isoform X1 [Patiria miniata]XP_038058216.1 cytoplasmic dynein 1 intermediate chain 2-like isoform X1 [Patiria miniata]XP_038058217.1 cytoplasmic dynein 1 intermediate chain 2-like isoform X1 [Patiria miniata]